MVFSPSKGHFLFIFSVSLSFSLSLFWPPSFCVSFSLSLFFFIFFSSFLSLFLFSFGSLFLSHYFFFLLCFSFMKGTTSKKNNCKFFIHQYFIFFWFPVFLSLAFILLSSFQTTGTSTRSVVFFFLLFLFFVVFLYFCVSFTFLLLFLLYFPNAKQMKENKSKTTNHTNKSK